MKILGFVVFAIGMLAMTSAEDSKCKLDLGLVVDTTQSIKEENIPILTAALKHLVQQFDISEDGTHVSFQTFAKETKHHNTFKDAMYYSENAIVGLISNSIELSKPTRIDLALKTAAEKMFTDKAGLRPGVAKAMVLYTDGRSHPQTNDFYLDVVALKARGVRLVVVGVGPDAKKPKYHRVLEVIGGEKVLFVDDYANLNDHTNDILKLICPPNPCENSKGMDVAFLVDRTKSLTEGDFMLLKGFIAQIAGGLNIGRDATRLGMILFDSHPKVISTFTNEALFTKDAVNQFIEKIPTNRFSPTRTDRALLAANNQLFTPEGGDREKFPNVLIVFTDGKTHPKSQPFAEITPLLKAKHVHMMAVGVGQHEDFQGQLEEIAGDYVLNVDNFDELSNLFSDILAEVCREA